MEVFGPFGNLLSALGQGIAILVCLIIFIVLAALAVLLTIGLLRVIWANIVDWVRGKQSEDMRRLDEILPRKGRK